MAPRITFAAIGFGAAAAWMVSTSFLFCYMAGHLERFAFPYTQWPEIASQWRDLLVKPHSFAQLHDMLLWPFIWAPVLPTGAVGITIVGMCFRGRQTGKRGLLGGSKWAGDDDLRSGKIHSRRF